MRYFPKEPIAKRVAQKITKAQEWTSFVDRNGDDIGYNEPEYETDDWVQLTTGKPALIQGENEDGTFAIDIPHKLPISDDDGNWTYVQSVHPSSFKRRLSWDDVQDLRNPNAIVATNNF